MSSEDQKPPKEEGKKVESKPDVPESAKLDPKKADLAAEQQFKSKYGFKKAPPAMAQRKISQTGGKQYFDSGSYNTAETRKDKQDIASLPHIMNPHIAQMRAKGHLRKINPSKLSSTKSPLAG